jgi:NADPH:quinone reductase
VVASMRAVVSLGPGGPSVLTLGEVAMPSPGPGQLLLRVRAAALNHADMLQREGEFPPSPGESEVLGVEIAGDVVAAGAGSRAIVGTPMFGLVGGGGYADYCLIDDHMAFDIPAGFSYAEAASLPEVYFTGDTTMFQLGGLTSGQTVLVHGGGSGLGTACIQMAKSAGARVACTVGSAAKATRALALGAELAINYRQQDFVTEVRTWTAGQGVDLVEDIVGASYLTRNLAALKDGGRLLQVGIIGGTVCSIDLDTIVLRRLHLIGSVMRPLPLEAKRAIAHRFRDHWLPRLAARRLAPVVDSIVPVAEVVSAHERLGRSDHFGKIILDLYRANDLAGPGSPVPPDNVYYTRTELS